MAPAQVGAALAADLPVLVPPVPEQAAVAARVAMGVFERVAAFPSVAGAAVQSAEEEAQRHHQIPRVPLLRHRQVRPVQRRWF